MSVPAPKPRLAPHYDPDEILRHVEILVGDVGDEDDFCVEVRVLKADIDRQGNIVPGGKYPKTIAGWFDNPAKLAEEVRRIRGVSVYVTVNPVSRDLLARVNNRLAIEKSTTNDSNIIRLWHWFLDFDPKRPAGISATETERVAAVARRDQFLKENPDIRDCSNWGTSGNGTFVLVSIGYPNDPEHVALIAKATELVARRYSDGRVEVDTATTNPSRIMALAGTMKCKGENHPDRPHRMVRFEGRLGPPRCVLDLEAWLDDQSEPVEPEPVEPEPAATASSFAGRTTGDQDGRWTPEARAVAYLQKCDPAVSGQKGHAKAFKAACKVGPGFDLHPDTALRLITEVYNPTCDPVWSEKELRHKVDDAYKVEKRRGWLLDEPRKDAKTESNGRHRDDAKRKDSSEPSKPSDGSDASEPSNEALGLVCLDTIPIKPVKWLWPDRIPLGKLTLLAGEGEIGKTFLTLDIIARLTTGRAFPDFPDFPIEPCDCVFVTAEDGLGDTIVPRLKSMGADLSRVLTITTGKLPNGRALPFTIDDIDRLEWIMKRRPLIRFIAIDPIAAFLGRVDENKNAELRAVLGPLSDFADRSNVAILPITHFGKNPSTKATARILGSVAYSNAARVTWCVVPDPEDEERRLMLRVKNNLSPNRTGMAYTINVDGVVVWEPNPIHSRVGDVLASSNAKPGEKNAAKLDDFLRDLLIPAPMPGPDVIDKARGAGFGKDAIWAAKKRLPIKAEKTGMNGGWVWRWIGPIPSPSDGSNPSDGSEPSEPSKHPKHPEGSEASEASEASEIFGDPPLHSHNSPDSPLTTEQRRATVRAWPAHWYDRYADLAGQLSQQGHKFPAEEIEAFRRVSAEKAETERTTSPFAGKTL